MKESKKKIVLFDIDYTLFNAQQFRESFFEILATQINHENRDDFLDILEDTYVQTKKHTSFFDPVSFLSLLNKKIPLENQQELEKAIMQEKILESSLYQEAKEVLKTLSKEKNIVLGILSWGNIPTQKAKIKFIKEYLHEQHIHIVEVDKRTVLPTILQKYQDYSVYLVDDFQEVLAKAKEVHPDLYTIWIKHPEIAGQKNRIFQNFVPDSIINSLSEVVPLIVGRN